MRTDETKVLVGTTVPPYVFGRDARYWSGWLRPLSAQVDYLAVLERDGRGLAPFAPLLKQLEAAGGKFLTFAAPEGQTEYTTANRLAGICHGRNAVQAYAMAHYYDWILFCDADVTPHPDQVQRLRALFHPVCAAHVPTYCLSGPPAIGYPEAWDVQSHVSTAGALFVHRDVFSRVTWRWDTAKGMSDDPCYHADALALGYPTYVRHDTVATHFPERIPPLEERGHDRRIRTPSEADQP